MSHTHDISALVRNLLVLSTVMLACQTTSYGQGLAIFQDGRDGYAGTHDVELNAEFNTPRGAGLGDNTSISIDESNGGFPTQGALRFDDIFAGQGTGTYDRIPLDQEIFFAEIRLIVTSATDSDAVISFNRVLGADQNRLQGTGVWDELDTWFSLGGDQIVEGGVLVEKPIEVGESTTLAVGNEAVSATLSGFDPVTEEQYGILSDDQNDKDFDFEDLETGASSINVTESLRLWQANPSSNFGWAINNTTSGGWDFLTSEWSLADSGGITQADLDALGIQEYELRPQLRVAYGVAGDINQDGMIDGNDYAILRGNLGNDSAFRGEPGDLDYDTDVDLNDFTLFKAVYEDAHGLGSFATLLGGNTVPEPSSALLMALVLGAAGVAGCRAIRR